MLRIALALALGFAAVTLAGSTFNVNAEEKKAALIVAYGTGEFDEATHGKVDLIIDDWGEVRALGLHKPTRFALSLNSRMQLL